MSSSVRDITESTEAEGRDDTHHGSTLGTDPCRTSTKPSTSNEPVCGLRSLGEQPNQKSSIDQRSSDEEPDKPSSKHRDSSATQSAAHSDPVVEHRTSVSVYGLRPAESINSNNISEASEARSSSHDLHRHSLGRRTLDHRDGSHYSAGGRSPIGDSAQTQQNMAPSISISNASNTVSAANSIMAKSMVSGSIVVIAERTKHGGAERQLQAQHATVNEQQQRAQKAGSTQHAMHLQRGCQQQQIQQIQQIQQVQQIQQIQQMQQLQQIQQMQQQQVQVQVQQQKQQQQQVQQVQQMNGGM